MSRKSKSTIAAAALAIALTAGNAAAQDQKFELKFSSWVPPSHGMHPAVNQWLESIGKASGGSITGKLFPAQQFGRAPDHYDMARDGIAEVTFISVGIQTGRLPIAEGGNLFFLHNNGDAGSRAYDAWYRKYAAQEMKDVKFCFGFVHDPGTFFSKKAVRVPADLKGVKVRSSNSQTSDLLTDIGAVNVNLAAPEMRAGLKSGVVEAVMGPWKSNILFGLDKVVTFATDMNLYTTSFAVLAQQGGLREDVGGAEKGHGRTLLQPMGRRNRQDLGRLRSSRTSRTRCKAGLYRREADGRGTWRMGQSGRRRQEALARVRQESRHRRRQSLCRTGSGSQEGLPAK